MDRFQTTAIVILVLCFLAHLLPTIALSFRRRNKSSRPVWTTYLVWLVLLPMMFGPLIAGRVPFAVACLAASVAGILEFARHTPLKKERAAITITVVAVCALYVAVFLDNWVLLMSVHFAYFSALVLYALRSFPEDSRTEGATEWWVGPLLSMFLYTYCGAFLSFLPLFYNHGQGREFLFVYLFLLINNDAFGYIFGSLLGKRRITPTLSPNKTVEGLLAGVAMTIVLGLVLRPYLIPEYSTWRLVPLCVLLALGGTIGDLVMSMCKRALQLKEFGTLIPGHGGVLDRLDSLLFAAPAFYFYLVFVN